MNITVTGNETVSEIKSLAARKINREGTRDDFISFRRGSVGKTKDEVVSLAISFGVVFDFDLTEIRERAYVTIDNIANKVDAKYTTTGGQMPAIYRGKIRQCENWLADGSPSDISTGSYGYIRAEVKRLGILNQPATTQDAVNFFFFYNILNI